MQLEDAASGGLLPPGTTLQQLVAQHLWPQLPASLARSMLAADAEGQPVLTVWPASGRYGSLLLALPLRTLLPHATYALTGALAAAWLLQAATRRLRGAAAATAAAQLVLALLVQVSDRNAPLILLLGLVELVAIAKLLAQRSQLLPAGSSAAAGVPGEAAALVALVAAQLFFATGHLCEFAGLQYTAGTVRRHC